MALSFTADEMEKAVGMMSKELKFNVIIPELKDQGYRVWWGGKNDLVPNIGEGTFDAYCDVHDEPVPPEGDDVPCAASVGPRPRG